MHLLQTLISKKSSFREFLDRHLKENRTKYKSSFREVRHLRGRHLRGFTVYIKVEYKKPDLDIS